MGVTPDAAHVFSKVMQEVAADAVPAVVYVRADKGRRLAPELQELFIANGLPPTPWLTPEVTREASGSGLIISPDGRVLTNHHVIEGALTITLVTSDQRQLPAHVIGEDPRTDLALLQIDVPQVWPYLTLSPKPVSVGQFVMAVGNPFDFQSSVSAGVVSALGRRGLSTREIQDYIQTDATVNPGNSGGPLLDLDGHVVGINTAIFAPQAEQSAGISFAIPAVMALRVLDEMENRPVPRRPWIGVVPRSVEDVEGDPTRRGAEIDRVWPNSPAERAGLRRGDTVIRVDGEAVPSADDLRALVLTRGSDVDVDVVVRRDERELSLVVHTVDEHAAALGTTDVPPEAVLWSGLTLVDPIGPWLAVYGVPMARGALVIGVAPRSVAAKMGIAAGDLLVAIGGTAVNDTQAIATIEGGPAPTGSPTHLSFVPVRIERAGASFYTLLPRS